MGKNDYAVYNYCLLCQHFRWFETPQCPVHIHLVTAVQHELSNWWEGRPFGQNRHGRKSEGCCTPFSGGGDGSACNTTSPGRRGRPNYVPSGILIHPAVWPQQTWAKKWGSWQLLWPFPWRGELGSHLTQRGLCRGLPLYQVVSQSIQQPTSWSIWPFVTIHRRYMTDRQTDNCRIALGEPFAQKTKTNLFPVLIWHRFRLGWPQNRI